jgi:hypothetical protein
MNPRAMVPGCPRGDRSSCQVITFTRATAEAKPHAAPMSRREKGPTVLSAVYGMLAMLPVMFDVARYLLVFR